MISCYQACRLEITYQTSELTTKRVSFHPIGKISDGRWHKIALYIFPHSHPKKTVIELYVDCKVLSRKKMLTPIENLAPASVDAAFLFAQRGGGKGKAIQTWKVIAYRRIRFQEYLMYNVVLV